MSGPGKIRIGISGWTYKPWRGSFYPKGLPQKRELAHAASIFPSVEINGTFYGMGLPYPPPGAEWIRVGADALLVDIFTGEILDVAYDAFYW